MTRALFILFIGCLLFGAIFLASFPKWYLKNGPWTPDNDIGQRLHILGDSAIKTADVPVAAVLLYQGHILGQGYNTVRRSANAGGHAEINALSSALKAVGVDSFEKLDRSELRLVTTWEPCLMCRGAIVEYNIKHVIVLKMKPLSYWMQQWKKVAGYEWRKQQGGSDTLQDELFHEHPLYRVQKER